MSNLNNDLINKIMLYVSHPCADMIRNCLCNNGTDNVLRLKNKVNLYLVQIIIQ